VRLYGWLDARADEVEALRGPLSWLFISMPSDLREDVGLRWSLPRRKWLKFMFLSVLMALPVLCKLASALCYAKLTGRPPWA